MRSDRLIATVDFHTAGIGMRLATAGLGRLPGDSIAGETEVAGLPAILPEITSQLFFDPDDPLRAGLLL